MLNKLYKSVFGERPAAFDKTTQYYTFVMDFSEENDSSLKNKLENYIGCEHAEVQSFPLRTTDHKQLVESVSGNASSCSGKSTRTSYVAIFDYAEEDITPWIEGAIKALIDGDCMNTGDRISVIVKIPSGKKEYCASLGRINDIDFSYKSKARLYMVSNNLHSQDKVNDDICGIILFNQNAELVKKLDSDFEIANRNIQSEYNGIGEDGKSLIDKYPGHFWSTVNCEFNNDRMDYLNSSISFLCDNCKRLTYDAFESICDKENETIFNSDTVESRDVRLKSFLEKAVKKIPVVSNEKKYFSDENSLDSFLEDKFGIDGRMMLDLTLESNLSSIEWYTPEMIRNTADSVFKDVEPYYCSDSLYETVCGFVSGYISRRCNSERVPDFATRTGLYNNLLSAYISGYIKRYLSLKKGHFWKAVYDYIIMNADRYSEQTDAAKKKSDEFNELRNSLKVSTHVSFGKDTPSFYIGDIINAYNSSEICDILKMNSDVWISGKETKSIAGGGVIPNMFLVPQFYHDCAYSLSVNGYSVNIKQQIGKYFLYFERGISDV